MANGSPPYPDFSQPSIMNPRYDPAVARMLGPLIREMQRQQQFRQAWGMNPRQAVKPTPEEMQRALNVGLAFGGADITKEQKEAWEAENAKYRAKQKGKGFEPGTRVQVRPVGARKDPSTWTTSEVGKPETKRLSVPYSEGVVVIPGTPEAGESGNRVTKVDPVGWPDPENFVAVRGENDRYWWWRHRDDLEILPTEDFPHGTEVTLDPEWGDLADHGVVTQPPKGAMSRPGPNYVWVDIKEHPEKPQPPAPGGHWGPKILDIKPYAGGNWGAWISRSALEKKAKK